jgi:Na+-driven multidrug efflux pump
MISWDKEARRIFNIAIPSIVGSATSTITSAVSTALVSYHLGTDNYVAYSMVYVVFGFADSLYGGIAEAKNILVSQAIGAGNHFLAGQYEQAAFLMSYIFAIPLYAVVWLLCLDFIARELLLHGVCSCSNVL